MRPGRAVITTTRVDSASASCRLWVTKTTVLRVRRQMSSSHSPMSRRVCSSRAPKGSSIRTIGVSIASARPMATRWRMPPDSSRGYFAREVAQAERPQQVGGDRATALARHALQLEAELHVLERGPPGKEAGVLEHGGDAARIGRRDGLPVDRDAAGVGRDEAADHAEQRGLAAAGGADQRAELAVADGERDVAQRVDRARSCVW